MSIDEGRLTTQNSNSKISTGQQTKVPSQYIRREISTLIKKDPYNITCSIKLPAMNLPHIEEKPAKVKSRDH